MTFESYLRNKSAMLMLSALASITASAQTTITGDWKDFGITNQDTTITMDCKELATNNKVKLFYADYREQFEISASMCFETLVTEQAFICKEGLRGEMFADLTIGYDPGTEHIFAEVKDEEGQLHRIVAGARVTKGTWYDVKVKSVHDQKKHRSNMILAVTTSETGEHCGAAVSYKGYALRYNVTRWVVGHGFPGGFPNSLQVRNGSIKNLKFCGTGKKREKKDKTQSSPTSSQQTPHAPSSETASTPMSA